MKTLMRNLRRLGACSEAVEWANTQPDPETLWRGCHRGDWMLWLAARAGVRRQDVVLAACACARLALSRVTVGEERPRIAIETAEAWARGDAGVTLAQVRAAADAAAYAADAAADAAAYAAAYASDAAAYAAAAAAARAATRSACASLVRERIPWSAVAAALAPAALEIGAQP